MVGAPVVLAPVSATTGDEVGDDVAGAVLGERVRLVQAAGLTVAALAVVLIGVG